jgi:hypothetical protein
MKNKILRLLFTFSLALPLACSNCPPCPGDNGTGKTPGATAAVLGETDAGVDAPEPGSKPKEVTSYDLHGRAGFPQVNIFERPDMDSPRLGYMRKGQRTKLGDPAFSSESCPNGWFKLPEGGFVCQGRGMLVGKKPRYIPRVPPPIMLDELDPYRHGLVKEEWTPLYKRVPAEEEIWTIPIVESETEEEPETVAPPQEDGILVEEEPPEPQIIPHSEEELDGGVNYFELAKTEFKVVRSFLSRGFLISIDERYRDPETGHWYYQTVKGNYVPEQAIHPINPPDSKGYQVLGDSPLPAVIIKDKRASFYKEHNGRLRRARRAERLSSYRVYDMVKQRGSTFYKINNNRWLRSNNVVVFEQRPLPEGVGETEKWILVDLSRQTLEAYQGTTPVYVTLISSGLPGSEETVTPSGKFRIRLKHLTTDMEGSVGDEEAYSVEDVPWVQFFNLNIAFHASFWHARYGTPKSHGCINMAPRDARWLFNWTEPGLPQKWHGVLATEKTAGTLVIVQGQTPAD